MNTASYFTILSAVVTLSASPIVIADTTGSDTDPVQLETEEPDSSGPQPYTESSEQEADQLWQKTKKETGEAADAAADYSRVQGNRAVEGTKEGVSKGTEAVTSGSREAWEGTKTGVNKGVDSLSTASKKAWEATKEATGKALDATGNAIKKVGESIEGAFDDGKPAPVSERNVETGSGASNET